MRTSRTIIAAIALGAFLPGQDAARLVELLGDPEQRDAASQRLRGLGAPAIEPLLAAVALGPTDAKQTDRTRAVLGILASMRGNARQAVAPLVKKLRDANTELEPDLLRAIADLALFAADDPVFSSDRPFLGRSISKWTMATHRENARLLMRRDIAKELEVQRAVQLVNGVRAWSIEAGLDFLIDHAQRTEINREQLAPALARSAELLDLGDPRISGTELRVPVRTKAAELILAVAPNSQAAERATAVLRGAAPAVAKKGRPLPTRFTQRVTELIDELRDPKTRAATADNLVALGRPAANQVVTALANTDSPEQREALLTVLRRMGRHAAHIAPDLYALLWQLPMDHNHSLCTALAATGTWSRDVLNVYTYSASNRSIKWDERPLQGEVTSAGYGGAAAGFVLLNAAFAMDPSWPADRLAGRLSAAQPDTRLLVLQVLQQRGAAALPALDAVAEAMDATGIKGSRLLLEDDGITVESVDRTKEVQRAAARALLAIAPADDPRRERAEQLVGSTRGGRPDK